MATNQDIIKMLQTSYWMELETVMNYLANSTNLDGIRSEEIREILSNEVQEEIGHAQQLANRIKELDGIVEGSEKFKAEQKAGQPPQDTTDLKTVVEGVIQSEKDAIDQYRKIIEATEQNGDYVTQDMCIALQADEEKHLRLFRGFLKDLKM
ncbi:MAG: rubrerythrin [Bacteroidetes bacterium SW_11_45_7]|nr:MAG: rubrerythrin [Bacteroidetes bacterium SW_11_45_7]